MKRFLVILSAAIIFIILLMILVPYAFRGKLAEIVKEEANNYVKADVDFSGITISLFREFPGVYLAVEDLTVTGKEKFALDTLASIDRLGVRANLLDLLSGEYRIRQVYFNSPRVLLKVLPDGSANWDILPQGVDTLSQSGASQPANFELSIDKVEITDGFIIYEDPTANTYLAFTNLDNTLSGSLSAARTDLRTHTTVEKAYLEYDGIPYLNNYSLDLSALIDANLENNVYTFQKNELKINEMVIEFDGSAGLAGDDINLMLNYRTPSNTFKQLLSIIPRMYTEDFEGIEADGTFNLDGYIKGVYNEEQFPEFRINLSAGNGYFKYPGLPGAVENIVIEAVVKNESKSLDNTIVDIRQMNLKMDENYVELKMMLKDLVTDPFVMANIDADLDLGDVKNFYPLEGESVAGRVKSDIEVEGRLSDLENERYGKFRAIGSLLANDVRYSSQSAGMDIDIENVQVNFSPAYLDLVDLDGSMGRSDIEMKGRVENYMAYLLSDGVLSGNIDMKSALLDLDELVSGETAAEEEMEEATGGLSIVRIPPDIHFVFEGTVDSLILSGLEFTGANTRIEIRDRKLFIEELESGLYDGTISITGTYDTWDPQVPLVDLDFSVSGMEMASAFEGFYLLRQYAPFAEKVVGDLNLDLSFTSLLNESMLPVLSSLTGKGSARTSSLQVSGVNTLDALATNLRVDELKEMTLNPVNLSFQFADGIMNVKPFDFKYKDTRFNLAGWTSFDRDIGYTMKIGVPRNLLGDQANDLLSNLASGTGLNTADMLSSEYINFTALVDGTLDDPKLKLDLASTGKELIEDFKKKGEEVLEQKKEEVEQQVKEEAEKILAEADRRADQLISEAQAKAEQIRKNAVVAADQTRKQANDAAAKLQEEAKGKGAIAVAAAKTGADKLRKEGEDKAQQIISEADKQADKVIDEAKKKAGQIRREAQERVDKL